MFVQITAAIIVLFLFIWLNSIQNIAERMVSYSGNEFDYRSGMLGALAASVLCLSLYLIGKQQKTGYISDICEGRFRALAPYFRSVLITDLKDKTEAEVCETLPKELQLLGSAFYKTVLEKHLAINFNHSPDRNNVEFVHHPPIRKGVLVFTPQQLCPSRWKKNGRLYVRDICNCYDKDDLEKVTWIFMRRCHLFDEDMKDLADLVERLPNLKVIDISWNGFHGLSRVLSSIVDDGIMHILPKVRYLDITFCPFATVDREDFFNSNKCNDEKIIWIPAEFLEGKSGVPPGWHNIIADPQRRLRIMETHYAYYQLCEELRT